MSEINKFKVWDWHRNEWLSHEEYGDVLEFNWHVCGEHEGECWGELKYLPDRNLEMVFANEHGQIETPG